MPTPPPGSPQAAFPQLGTEFVDEYRNITIPWYRFLIELWRLAGGQNVPISNAVYFVLNLGPPPLISVYSIFTGDVVGIIQLQDQPGKPAVSEAPGSSPFVFTAAKTGTLVVYAGASALSRDGGVTYFPVSLNGAAIPMLKTDKVQVTWAAGTPEVTWFPSD